MISKHRQLFPTFHGRYIEPFLGGAAVFFYLRPRGAWLSDKNGELVTTYRVVRDNAERINRQMNEYHQQHSSDFYYEIRDLKPTSDFDRACRFLYLNRVCFNGLYRVNKRGEFNVPIGSKSEVKFPRGYLKRVSAALRGTSLTENDFEVAIDRAGRGDFVYLDPPYTVSHNNNGFIKYNDELFSWDDQIRLSRAAQRASRRGALVFVSNADHDALKELYPRFRLHTLTRASVLSGEASARRQTSEAAFLNYAPA